MKRNHGCILSELALEIDLLPALLQPDRVENFVRGRGWFGECRQSECEEQERCGFSDHREPLSRNPGGANVESGMLAATNKFRKERTGRWLRDRSIVLNFFIDTRFCHPT